MSVAARTATLIAFSPAPKVGPARARRAAGSPVSRTPVRTAAIRTGDTGQETAGGRLRRAAVAMGMGAALLASVGAAGWGFVAAEQAARDSLASYVSVPAGAPGTGA